MRLPNTSSSFLNRLDSLGKVESTAEVRADTGCRGLSLKTIKWILKNNFKKKNPICFLPPWESNFSHSAQFTFW